MSFDPFHTHFDLSLIYEFGLSPMNYLRCLTFIQNCSGESISTTFFPFVSLTQGLLPFDEALLGSRVVMATYVDPSEFIQMFHSVFS